VNNVQLIITVAEMGFVMFVAKLILSLVSVHQRKRIANVDQGITITTSSTVQ